MAGQVLEKIAEEFVKNYVQRGGEWMEERLTTWLCWRVKHQKFWRGIQIAVPVFFLLVALSEALF